ncbi:MAG: hypothetical protein HC945_01000 [Nitrosarchaeum sp.]|nr:hypothetical protein [Nitrosarchaeum sp.]
MPQDGNTQPAFPDATARAKTESTDFSTTPSPDKNASKAWKSVAEPDWKSGADARNAAPNPDQSEDDLHPPQSPTEGTSVKFEPLIPDQPGARTGTENLQASDIPSSPSIDALSKSTAESFQPLTTLAEEAREAPSSDRISDSSQTNQGEPVRSASQQQDTSRGEKTSATSGDPIFNPSREKPSHEPFALPKFPAVGQKNTDPVTQLKTSLEKIQGGKAQEKTKRHLLDRYTLEINKIIVDIKVIFEDEKPVPIYFVSISNISDTTKIILEKIRLEFVSKINIEDIENFEENEVVSIRDQFKTEIKKLIQKYFPQTDQDTANMLVNYLIEENLGLGKIEILLRDPNLEEIVINNHAEPVWVYHRKYGWLETNIKDRNGSTHQALQHHDRP